MGRAEEYSVFSSILAPADYSSVVQVETNAGTNRKTVADVSAGNVMPACKDDL
jgi:hypothetical protein